MIVNLENDWEQESVLSYIFYAKFSFKIMREKILIAAIKDCG
jgi:hypothetical protein